MTNFKFLLIVTVENDPDTGTHRLNCFPIICLINVCIKNGKIHKKVTKKIPIKIMKFYLMNNLVNVLEDKTHLLICS